MGLFHKMLPVAAVLAALAALDALRPNLEFHAVISLVVTATGALWVAVGVWRPGRAGRAIGGVATPVGVTPKEGSGVVVAGRTTGTAPLGIGVRWARVGSAAGSGVR